MLSQSLVTLFLLNCQTLILKLSNLVIYV
ncbi:UNVERIFIED_CONTAM: hypothetical protein GTU68_047031 [Idotea baltica]|nr:hypothetical protein [Idotea baltica]